MQKRRSRSARQKISTQMRMMRLVGIVSLKRSSERKSRNSKR